MSRHLFTRELGDDMLQDARWMLVERIAASQSFHSADRLKDFLFYVTVCALKDAPDEATEQHIGIHVFQRPAGYDSAEFSIVRTNARLLRQKLAEYFQNEGSHEEIVVEIPKGHYLPAFRPRVGLHSELPNEAVHANTDDAAVANDVFGRQLDKKEQPRRGRIWLAVALALSVSLAGAAWLGMHRHEAVNHSVIDRLWNPFWTGNPPLVIFSNVPFVGNQVTGMKYAPLTTDPNSPDYLDTYTGVGEVSGVYELTRLFDDHRTSFILKRSLLVTWDEAKQKNLIFIGSIVENPALRVMSDGMDFAVSPGIGAAIIVDRHPRLGEPAVYSRPTYPQTKDYSIVALIPGLTPGRRVLILSGLSTLGTQAAVDFVCRPKSVEQLIRAASGPSGTVHMFEAIIETKIDGGVPLESRLLVIHVH